MRPFSAFKCAGLAVFVIVVMAASQGTALAKAKSSLNQTSTGDLFFLPDAHVVVVHGGPSGEQCLGGTGPNTPCDVFFIAAPFVCGDCGADFAVAFHSGGNLTIGLGPQDACPQFPTSFLYTAAFNPSAFLANEEKGALSFTLPVYFSGPDGTGTFFALVRLAFIDKNFGLLEITGNAALSTLTASPVDVEASLVEGNSSGVIAGSCAEVPAVLTELATPPVQATLNPIVSP